MSGILIISLVVVFGPMLCLLGLAMRSAWPTQDRPATPPDPSADEWLWRHPDVARHRPADEVRVRAVISARW